MVKKWKLNKNLKKIVELCQKVAKKWRKLIRKSIQNIDNGLNHRKNRWKLSKVGIRCRKLYKNCEKCRKMGKNCTNIRQNR